MIKNYPNNLLVYYKNSGKTQEEIAAECGVFQTQLANMINGFPIEIARIKQQKLTKAIFFDGNFNDLFEKYDFTRHFKESNTK